jgi:hypothetical protein
VSLPELSFNDDKDGKPVAINEHIGRRPIMAFGDSHGDKRMLEHTQAGAVGVAGICARPTAEISKLQADLIAAVAPFTVETGPISAFTAPRTVRPLTRP